jgi:hypothetical protein
MGDVFNIDEEFTAVRLDANTAHRWTIEIFEDESFTVSAIAPPPADMVLSITRDGQPVITQQNTTGAGTAETIREPSLPGEGTYEIVVQNGGGAATEYALIAYIAGDFEVQFKGFLSSSTPQSNVTMAAEESHYWFFMAGAGNQLDATLTPDANADIVGEFFGPEAEFLEIADEGVAGEAESLESLPLAASGMHVVRISEIDYAGMNYSILITLR